MSNTTPIDPGSTLLTLPAGLPALNCYSVTDINLPFGSGTFSYRFDDAHRFVPWDQWVWGCYVTCIKLVVGST
jgi:hypothetical protein|tara:strand:- start:128 stop:346 length:219 start_codon:yes stop_codon:yes gene_type:complete